MNIEERVHLEEEIQKSKASLSSLAEMLAELILSPQPVDEGLLDALLLEVTDARAVATSCRRKLSDSI